MNSKRTLPLWCTALCLCTLLVITLAATGAYAQSPKSGSTLQAAKTLDICDNGDGTWKYFGEVAVWNTGTADAQGLNITDCLQAKLNSDKKSPQNVACLLNVQNNGPSGPTTTVPGLTPEGNALVFAYDFTGTYSTPLDPSLYTIRNSAQVNITNHSGGIVTGPNPKDTWAGGTPPSCTPTCGCTLTQGYWRTHPEAWPAGGPQPGDLFFNSGLTYLEIMLATEAGGNAYVKLAHQYIAAVLNVANGACEPQSVVELIAESTGFFSGFPLGSSFCSSSLSGCPLQVTWAGLLDTYNSGTGAYASNPGHCGDSASLAPINRQLMAKGGALEEGHLAATLPSGEMCIAPTTGKKLQ